MMRLSPLLGTLAAGALLTGCLDSEAIQFTMAANARKGFVDVEARAISLHHEAAEGCTTVDACRAALLKETCASARDIDAPGAVGTVAVVEPRADGHVDLVTRYQQPVDALVLPDGEEGYRGATLLKRGGVARDLPLVAWADSDTDLVAEVLAGRFEQLSVATGPDELTTVWVMRSKKGTLRFTVRIDAPSPDDELRWMERVPGLAASLAAEPVSCADDTP